MAGTTYTAADLDYIRANYLTLEQLCEGRPETPREIHALVEQRVLPQPAYVLEDGTGMFPADHLRLADEAGGPSRLQADFAARYEVASLAEGTGINDLDACWDGYLRGIYGVCLHDVTPETIVRKNALVSSLCELLVLAKPASDEWREALRAQVEELEAMERPFSPDYDRKVRFGRPTTRDLLLDGARERFPGVFAEAAVAA